MEVRRLRNQQYSIQGKTLLEYLIVAVIVGVLTLACVPAIKNMTAKASEGKAKQNARTICDLYNSARSVDVVFSTPTKAGIANELFDGVQSPTLTGSFFQMPRLAGHDLVDALRYCRYDPMTDMMTYQMAGTEMLEVVVIQDGLAGAAIGAVGLEDLEPETKDAAESNDAPWKRLPTWFTADPQQSQRVLDYILNNPRMVHYGVEFGTHEWRTEQGDNGLWWPEYRTR